MKNLALLKILLVFLLQNTFAQDGVLDASFDSDGIVLTSIVSTDLHGVDVAVQSDGRIIVVGEHQASGTSDFLIVRYNTNGTLDTSFDFDGIKPVDFGGSDGATSVIIQTDGKIIVGGYSGSSSAILRLNVNGTLDTSFDTDGMLVNSMIGRIQDLTLQSDNKIITAGSYTQSTGDIDFAVARYNTDGSLDTTFDFEGNKDGIVITDIVFWFDYANSAAIQADGKIIVAGDARTGSYNDAVVVRYNSDGSLDTSFDSDGIKIIPNGAGNDLIRSVAIKSDGKIIIGGSSINDFTLFRLNIDGGLDNTFGTNGKVKDVASSTQFGRSITLQSNGKILLSGYSIDETSGKRNIYTARYNTNGSLDESFGINGYTTSGLVGVSEAYSSILQSDGKILVVGEYFNGSNYEIALVRYNNPSLLTAVETELDLPIKYSLSQNYPNPFNPSTKIQYSLPKSSNVVLEVYNIIGEKVSTIVNCEMIAGNHEVYFDASNLSSGIYIYRIVAGNFVDVKKMILLQ